MYTVLKVCIVVNPIELNQTISAIIKHNQTEDFLCEFDCVRYPNSVELNLTQSNTAEKILTTPKLPLDIWMCTACFN